MDILEGRSELKRMSRGSLFTLVANQRVSKCLIGVKACGFSLQHQGIHFCVSELMGEGCLVERLENYILRKRGSMASSPFLEKWKLNSYRRERSPSNLKSIIEMILPVRWFILGQLLKEGGKRGGSNLEDLLKEAIKEYSDYVKKTSKIFLLAFGETDPRPNTLPMFLK